MKRLDYASRKSLLCLSLGVLLLSALLLSACGGEQPTATVAPPTIVLSPTPVPPTTIPTPVPTATLAPVATTEWGSVKSTGAEVKAVPDNSAPTLEKLSGFTIVSWQRKLPDESWLERSGGGWIQRREVIIYNNESEARRGVPQPVAQPSQIPTYNPNPVQVSNPSYTFAPITGPDAGFKINIPTPTPTIAKPSLPLGTPIGIPLGTTVAASNSPETKPAAT
ncbi:MAG: hypothetical protein WCS37_20180, partial [Chloroflexota bacterium]